MRIWLFSIVYFVLFSKKDHIELLQNYFHVLKLVSSAGSMLGCLMGARLGNTSIPEKWRENVLNAKPLYDIAQHLAELATKTDKVLGTPCCEIHSLQHLIDMECLKYIDNDDDN